MAVDPLRPISPAEVALRVELAPNPGQIVRPAEVPPVVSPQGSVMDHIALRTPQAPRQLPADQPSQPGPAQAVQVAGQAAAARQGGLAPLLADLALALKAPNLPAPVRTAIDAALKAQAPLGPAPSASDVGRALARSGLFLEANLAAILSPPAGRPPLAARAATTGLAGALAPGADAKAALLALRETLRTWLAGEGKPFVTAASAHATPPPAPPYRSGPTQGQPPAAASLPPDAPAEALAQRLIHSATAALAREELLQIASLPDAPPGAPKGGAEPQRWMFELPLATPQGPAVAQFEIARDGGDRSAGGGEAQPAWRVRFSIDVEPLGPVHAHVALKPGRTAVTLWAERSATAALLQEQGQDLGAALRRADMAADVAVYAGAPKAQVAEPGQFLDQAS